MKIFLVALIVFLAIISVLLAVISTIAKKNIASMNHCMDAALKELNKNYTVTAVNPDKYKKLTFYGVIKFNIEQYQVDDLGNLSMMRVNMGPMQMFTFIITPQSKNLPLLSADYMYILSNRKAYLEFYDVVKEKDEQYMQLMDHLAAVQTGFKHLDDFEPSSAWYDNLLTVASFKSCTSDADADLSNMLIESLNVYLAHSKKIPTLSEHERKEKLAITAEYTNGLINNGGVSTDIFKKQLGAEETMRFFDNVLFGTART